MVTRRCNKGSVSIYLLIMLLGLIFFLGLIIDLGRIRIAQNQLRKASNSAARSLLADYDSVLKNNYGLFALSTGGGEGRSGDFNRYLAANLSGGKEGDFCLLDYRLEENSIVMIRPLGDTSVLRQQILEEMKYRAPVDLSEELAGRLKGLAGLFNIFGKAEKEKKSLENIDAQMAEIRAAGRKIRDLTERRKKLREEIQEKEGSLTRLEEKLAETEGDAEKEKIAGEISPLKDAIEKNRKQSDQIMGEIKEEAGRVKKIRDGLEDVLSGLENSPGAGSPPGEADELDQAISDADGFIKDSLSEYTGQLKQDLDENCSPGVLEAIEACGDEGGFDAACGKLGADGQEDGEKGPEEEAKRKADELKKQLNSLKSGPCLNLISSIEGSGDSSSRRSDVIDTGDKILGLINMNEEFIKSRDEIFINEFVLSERGGKLRFQNLASNNFDKEGADAEYILCGSWMKALEQVWLVRYALDAPAYFVLRFKMLGPVWGTAVSLAVGAVQASVDTLNLLKNKEIGVIEVFPPESCRLQEIKVTYKDMLRLAALLNKDQDGKLKRIADTIGKRTGADMSAVSTAVFGDVTVSIRLWFLPALGIKEMKEGPFGTVIRGGRCYITKNVEYSY